MEDSIWLMPNDADGIAYADLSYGHLPRLFKWREIVANCPNAAQFSVPKTQWLLIRSLSFYQAQVIDCSSAQGGKMAVTTFRITAQGGVNITQSHLRSPDEQALLDHFDLQAFDQEILRIVQYVILFLLLFLIFLWWWTYWKALGPFRRDR